MEEGTDHRASQFASAAHGSHVSGERSSPGQDEAAATFPPPSTVLEGDELYHEHRNHREHRRSNEGERPPMRETITYHVTLSPTIATALEGNEAPWVTGMSKDDTLSCLVVLLTFWLFASVTLILGFYGSVSIVLGPNSSRLLRANSYFVQDIKLQLETKRPGPLFYGFSDPPPLDVMSLWSESHNVSIPANFHKEWVFYFNEGSQLEVSYNVKSPDSSPLVLVITQGTGVIRKKILKSSEYYVAVGNLNLLSAEVEINFSINALLYNTTRAYYNCSLYQGSCVIEISFWRKTVGILATSGPQQGQNDDGSNVWYAKMSYGPRWIMYFVGSGLLTVVVLVAFRIFSYFCSSPENTINSQAAQAIDRTPLLLNKDDDNSSLGSSYDSVSNDEFETEEHFVMSMEGPMPVSGKEVCEAQHLCLICCNAPKDCFFLPCGHSATCFACGTRLTEEAGTCPICRRRMKKVKKIFTV